MPKLVDERRDGRYRPPPSAWAMLGALLLAGGPIAGLLTGIWAGLAWGLTAWLGAWLLVLVVAAAGAVRRT